MMITLVLVFYDYMLTVPIELSHIWNGRVNVMKVLFIINRYAGVIFQFSLIFPYFFVPATNTVRSSHIDLVYEFIENCRSKCSMQISNYIVHVHLDVEL